MNTSIYVNKKTQAYLEMVSNGESIGATATRLLRDIADAKMTECKTTFHLRSEK